MYEPSGLTVAVPWAGFVFDTTDRPSPVSFARTPCAAGTDRVSPVTATPVSEVVATCVRRMVSVNSTTTSVPSEDVALGNVKDAVFPVPSATFRPLLTSVAVHVVV